MTSSPRARHDDHWNQATPSAEASLLGSRPSIEIARRAQSYLRPTAAVMRTSGTDGPSRLLTTRAQDPRYAGFFVNISRFAGVRSFLSGALKRKPGIVLPTEVRSPSERTPDFYGSATVRTAVAFHGAVSAVASSFAYIGSRRPKSGCPFAVADAYAKTC